MKKLNKPVISKVCILVGVCLFIVGTLLLISWQWNIHSSIKKSEYYIQTIRSIIPSPQGVSPQQHSDNTMPVLSVDGVDFVGILEIPRYESVLPVCADWGDITKYPCRFNGSIYNRTMQIGATSQKGQYDFYREISVGETVLFTDMAGNRYSYKIKNLRYEKHADQTALSREDSSLTLFIKNIYDFEYLIISCDVLN